MQNISIFQRKLPLPDNIVVLSIVYLKIILNIEYVISSYVLCQLGSKPADQEHVNGIRHVN